MPFRLFAAFLLLGSTLVSCSFFSHGDPQQPVVDPTTSLDNAGWYVASKEPLTFCPKGHNLPGVKFGILDGEYVYLADRSSRFYIPTGKYAQYYRNQALIARDASFKAKGGFMGSVTSKIAVVGNAIGSAVRHPMSLMGR